MPKAYSYIRFSTPEQSKGDSLRRQTALAQEYARRKGLELDEELTFHDVGVSAYRGRNAEAGQLAAFREAVDVGLVEPGSYLLVESLDKISRQSARRALRVLEDIVEAGITVVTLSDNREYTADSLDDDPTSLLMSVLIFMRSAEESATKAKRLRASWSNKRKNAVDNGHKLTRSSPAWLELSADRSTWLVDEERAAVVRQIFEWALQGMGQESIARTLNETGVDPWGSGKRAAIPTTDCSAPP